MTPRELRIISALAVFLTAGLPAAAGAIAFRAQPVLVGAIIGEELGLIGALVIIGMFLFMAVCFNNILRRTSDLFSRYVVAGVMLWITLQALVNIAVVLRLLPVLGVPLPFVSAGGSSLLSSLMGVGLVLAIERENHASPAPRARTVARPVRATR